MIWVIDCLELLHMDIWGPFPTSIPHGHNGPEFTSLSKFFTSKGIQQHQTSCVTTPQHNRRVERKHQCILNIAKTLLIQSRLPPQFWGYATLHAVLIMKKVPSNAIKSKIPFGVLYNKHPNMSELKVFGSLCFVSTQDIHISQIRNCVFLGLNLAWKVM
jgi:hypothetical protein